MQRTGAVARHDDLGAGEHAESMMVLVDLGGEDVHDVDGIGYKWGGVKGDDCQGIRCSGNAY
jgi:hypothetical protein